MYDYIGNLSIQRAHPPPHVKKCNTVLLERRKFDNIFGGALEG
jgi:hypothetical protein